MYKETDPNIVKEIRQQKEEIHPVVEAYSSGNLSGIDLLENKEDGEIPNPIIDSTLAPTATKVFVIPTVSNTEMKKYTPNSHGIVFVDFDKIMLEEGRHLMAYVEDKKFVEYSNKIANKVCEIVELAKGDEVVLTIGSGTARQFRNITKGSTMEDSEVPEDNSGLRHYLENEEFLRRVLKIIKRVRDLYKKRNVMLGVHAPMGGENMREFKKVLSSVGLRRSSTFNVYAVIDNPTEVILVDEIVKAKIDGIVLNMPIIAKQMQGINLNDKKTKYSLSTNSMLKVVDNVIDILKSSKSSIIVICEDDQKLVTECIQKGVYGVSVFPENIKDMRKLVAQEEARLILSK